MNNVLLVNAPLTILFLSATYGNRVESREMLGIMDQLRDNGLDHSPATRTQRSSRMCVKLQLGLNIEKLLYAATCVCMQS